MPIDAEADERALMWSAARPSSTAARSNRSPSTCWRPATRAAVERERRPGHAAGRRRLCTTPRHVFWNFVSSSRDRINQAKEDWQAMRFPLIPGDDQEYIPLPEVPTTVSYP